MLTKKDLLEAIEDMPMDAEIFIYNDECELWLPENIRCEKSDNSINIECY